MISTLDCRNVSRPMWTTARFGLAVIYSLPAAGLFAGAVALCFGEKDLPGDDWIIRASLLVGWLVLTIHAAKATDIRQTFRRTCLAIGGSAWLLPVAAVVFAVTEPHASDPIFPKTAIFLACLAGALTLSATVWLLVRYVPRLSDLWFGVVAGLICLPIMSVAIPWAGLVVFVTSN